MKRTLEWQMRVRLTNGGVMVGGYLSSKDGHLYIADELTGQVHQLDPRDVQDFDVRKY
jgi:outer membrane protein assembly factor BamB